MKNREWLLNTAAVDVLCEMAKELKKSCECEHTACIMDCFGLHKIKYECMGNCRDCIVVWLNEEGGR